MAQDLDKLYSPSEWSKELEAGQAIDSYFAATSEGSLNVKKTVPCILDVSFGNSPSQKLDIFGSDVLPKDAPIFVFIHGGYWIEGCRQDSCFFVEPLFSAGVICIVLGYDLIDLDTTLPDIVYQIRCGIEHVLKYAAERGSSGVFLAGHSAGAHLITMSLSSGSMLEHHEYIKGLILISGIYDLHPLYQTIYKDFIKLTKDIVQNFSPMSQATKLKENLSSTIKVLVVVAEYDSPAFIQQSKSFDMVLEKVGITSEYMLVSNEDHFSVVKNLSTNNFILTMKIIEFIKNEAK